MISQETIDAIFDGHVHSPTTHYIADDDVIAIDGNVRIPRKCSCGAVIEMKNKTVGGVLYRGWFE